MALENKYQKANRMLGEIIAATNTEVGYMFVPDAIAAILEKKGFVEVNREIKNDAGEVATRATKTGIKEISKKGEGNKMAYTDPEMASGGFEIEDVPVVKAARTGGGKKSLYPFDTLQVGQSFFVAATAAKPEPWKSMTSTVGTAANRYAEAVLNADGTPVMRATTKGKNPGKMVPEVKLTRKFAISKDTKNGVDGARIGRVA